MPKEIVHWSIAELIRLNLKEDSVLRKSIDENYSEYLIGSIAFDIPYYDFFSEKSEKLGSSLHGLGKDFAQTNYFRMLEFYGEELPSYVISFIAGNFCHAITDIVYHPVVDYYSGGDIKKHRQFETNLDLFYLGRGNLRCHSLSKILKFIKDKRKFRLMLSLFIYGNEKKAYKVSIMLLKYRIFQYIVRKKVFFYLFSFLNFVFKNKIDGILALFYGDFSHKTFKIFEYNLFFKGESISIEEIENKVLLAIKELFLSFEKATKEDLRIYFENFRFPPLDGKKD